MLWVGVSLMTIAFTIRAYIRTACFRRLFVEDWLMLISLCMFIACAIIGTMYLQPIYDLSHLADGSFIPGPDFEEDTIAALRGFAGTNVLINLGIWTIKLNFLMFFYRFGHQLPVFRVLWWFVFVFVIASGVVTIGIIQFECKLGDINTILFTCSSLSSSRETHRRFIVSVALDIFSDLLIIGFPVSIFWSSGMTLRQKLILSAIFCLVGFTIAITIVRGGFSLNVEDPSAVAEVNSEYDFWITLEYIVSFLIACFVSFRSLFTQRRNRTSLQARRQAERLHIRTGNRERGSGALRRKMRELYDTLLETCRELEGLDTEHEMHNLPMPASGLMTVDFSRGETASDWTVASTTADKILPISTHVSQKGSITSLKPAHFASSPV
ncbi:hypothetical protein F4818DRAFT_273034 [Hypoxylon cercidicola]|nr:hypothetical protein F4818DRAFT_273034 [Hypoxylon cercidicola]